MTTLADSSASPPASTSPTPPTPPTAPAAAAAPATTSTTSPTSLLNAPAPFVADPTKTDAENATAKAAHEAAAPAKASDTPAAPFVPLTVADFKLPDGLVADTPLQTEFLDILNDRTLAPKDLAQKLIDLQAKGLAQASEKNSSAWNDLQTNWKNEVNTDKDIGGDKLPAVLTRIDLGLKKFGSDETRKAFDMTGAGNNPAIIKFVNNILSALGEGTLVPGAKPGGIGTTEAQMAAKLYPTMTK